MKSKNLKLSGMMLAGVIVIVSLIYAVNIQPVVIGGLSWFNTYAELKTFNSHDELADFLINNCSYKHAGYCEYGQASSWGATSMLKSINSPRSIMVLDGTDDSNIDYSTTNIQVEGVDEPDVVKTDGKYLYILANSKIYIVKAYPAQDAVVLSIISLEDTGVSNFFINGDRLIVFSSSYRYPICGNDFWWGVSTTTIKTYDFSDRENPELAEDIEVDGSYFNARMIGNYVYIITTEYSYELVYNYNGNNTINIPEITINNCTRKLPANCIFYVNNSVRMDIMTNVISLNIDSGEVNQKSFLLENSQTMYVSKNNIYLACMEYNYYYPPLSDSNECYETTVIHKISINNGDISCTAQGKVPGRILNQFSMDEHNGFFRIATTVGNVWDSERKSSNNIYILNDSLNRTSEIENIAPGERIYSSRFMGKRAYLVTFKKVDPFFTIDLSDPNNPKILGELKIPGYSDYLHPYDDNHIIGIGKDTVEPQEEYSWTRDFAWYQGLKIALFDVSDFENPKVESQVIIGDRGTDSPVLHDHKAFLFDREKELLVIPVRLHEISDEIKDRNDGYTGSMSGTFTFQGAFVYRLSLENGFEYRGRVTHMDDNEPPDDDRRWYWGSSSSYISRSLYVENVLYTISDKMVKMNSLDDLSEINSILLK